MTPLTAGAVTTTLTSAFSGTLIGKVGLADGEAGSDAASAVYFNNLAIVPEPAALGLLASCGVGLLTRRRYNPGR
jgi:hypothetical protein